MNYLHWVARTILATVMSVELLGSFNLLSLDPEFTWKGLLLQSGAILAVFEILGWAVRRYKMDYVVGYSALAAALLIAFDAIGDIQHLYGTFAWFDQAMHTLGGFIAGLTVTSLLAAVNRKNHGSTGITRSELFVGGVTAAATLGLIYELVEYYEDLFTGSHRLGDGFDTAQDLSLDLFGGMLAAFLVVALPRLRFRR